MLQGSSHEVNRDDYQLKIYQSGKLYFNQTTCQDHFQEIKQQILRHAYPLRSIRLENRDRWPVGPNQFILFSTLILYLGRCRVGVGVFLVSQIFVHST